MDTRKAGKLGGDITKKKYGQKHFSNAGKKGMEARWGKKKEKIVEPTP